MTDLFPKYPVRYPDFAQQFQGTIGNPYPMNFMQAPSFGHQVLVSYGGRPMLQGLSCVRGPFMFPVRSPVVYPLTHSVLSPYQRGFLDAGLNYDYCTRKSGPC